MSTEQYDFNAWDNEIDTNAVAREVMKAQANTGQFEKVPYGSYTVAVDDIRLGKSKKDKKQMVVQFVITEHKTLQGRLITAFFGLEHPEERKLGFMLHNVNEFLRSFKTSVNIQGFQGFGRLNEYINAIKAEIKVNRWEYQLRFAQEKGYDTFTIEDKFELADQNDNIPF